MAQRQKTSTTSNDMGKIANNQYNEQSGAVKTLGPILGSLVPQGPANVTLPNQAGSLVSFFNSDTAVHYVAFGKTSPVTPPTGPTNGIPLPPGVHTILSYGYNGYAIADAATVFAYLVQDDSFIA